MTPSISSTPSPCFRRRRPVPVLTTGLAAAGALIYALLPGTGLTPTAWLSVEDLGVLNLVLVTAARVLVHPGPAHLALHLGLLACFGGTLERRLGMGPVLAAVLLGSVLTALIDLNLLIEPTGAGGAMVPLIRHPPIGFAGAVAGLMGLFLVERVLARLPSSTPLAATGAFLIALYLLGHWAAWEGTPFGSGGGLDAWAVWGAFLGGLGVGFVAAVADGDPDTPGAGTEKTKPSTVASAVSDQRPVRMAWPTWEGRVGA